MQSILLEDPVLSGRIEFDVNIGNALAATAYGQGLDLADALTGWVEAHRTADEEWRGLVHRDTVKALLHKNNLQDLVDLLGTFIAHAQTIAPVQLRDDITQRIIDTRGGE